MKRHFVKIKRHFVFVLALILALGLVLIPVGNLAAVGHAAAQQKDTDIAETHSAKTGLVAPPTVVFDVLDEHDGDVLPEDSAGNRPSNAILHLDAEGNIVSESGTVLGSLSELYLQIKGKVIPVISVSDEGGADKLIDFLTNRIAITDLAVHSEDASLVKKVRTAVTSVRGIVEYRELPEDRYTMVKESTEAGASVVILPQKEASSETVTYLQARFKTVWVRAESDNPEDIADSIYGGGYGIVTLNYTAVYDEMKEMSGYTRNIFNVAHRGEQNHNHENSLSAVEAAMRAGVTHLELDGHLTKDKHIIIMHDDGIGTTSNGKGDIKNMTLEEIRKYQLVDRPALNPTAEPERIPTLEEVIDLIRALNEELGTDVVLVFEIKDDQRDFVENMKKVLDEKEFYENLVIITFNNDENQLQSLRDTTPWIPTANLDASNTGNFKDRLVSSYIGLFAVYDVNNVNQNETFDRLLIDRGIMPWYWTYGFSKDVYTAAKAGVLGVTNNACEVYGDETYYVYHDTVTNATADTVPAVGGKIPLKAVNYRLEETDVEGDVINVVTTAKGWKVFSTYTYEDGAGESRTVYVRGVEYLKGEPAPEGLSAGAIAGIAVGSAAVVGAAVVLTVLLLRKKHSASAK